MNTQPIQKKVVSRNTAIALGIICIILAVGVVGTFTSYSSLKSQIEDKDSQISSLNSQITDKNNTITSLNSQIQNLTSQNNELLDIVYLTKFEELISSQTVNQTANSYNYWRFSVYYAGYVAVYVESSTIDTYVQLIYSSYGVDYDKLVDVGAIGTAVFPVLPAGIEIRVGNTASSNNATEIVTIRYYY